jgi:gas vesicle protein GvpL/GvpF
MSSQCDASERLRDALRALAEADAPGLIAEVRDRARQRAAKLLEDALVQELLEAAARTRSADGAESPSAATTWWVYCVVSAADAANVPPGLEGVEPGSVVELVREGKLAALISAVPAAEFNDIRLREHLEDLGWVERTARRHEAVLEQTLRHMTIVPMRLCTIYHDAGGVRRLLRKHADSLERSLAKVDRCAEWGVKVFADTSTPLTEEEQEVAELTERPGATYLVHRQRERERAQQASELRASCAETVQEQISALAREAKSNPLQRPELHGRNMQMLLNGAYLVANDRVSELQQAIRTLQDEWEHRGFVIDLTGPWPAYNFVSGAGGMP